MDSVNLQEKANFTRLSRLLVEKGTEALRNTFDTIHPPVSLPGVLATKKTSLQNLQPRVINNSQWDLLFPSSGNPPDSKTFDVTLLTVLFRNICGFPSTGWGVMPPDTDRSTQANITRIKCYRNEVIAHVTTTRVDNSTFQSLWRKISQAMVELGVSQSDVDDLEKCPLGPEEEVYVQKLKDWKLHQDECIKLLKVIEAGVNNVTQVAEETRDAVNETRDAVNETRDSVNETRDSVNETHDAVNETHKAVNETRDAVNETRQTLAMRTLSIPGDTNREKNTRTENDEDVLRNPAKHNFKGKIKRKVNFFLPGTREWLLREVNEWFQKCDNDSRIKLITAGPGFGKSVFAAKICEDFGKKGKLAACHFFDFSNANLRDPMVMLQSLASQMCHNVPGFKEELLYQLGRRHQVQNLRDAFQIYLQNPLDELEIKEPRLVVIDGLDESAADNKNEIMDLIAEYFPDLPEYIKILVTSRPEISVADLRLRDDQKIDISNDDANNIFDLELYLKISVPSLVDKKLNRIDLNLCRFENSYIRRHLWNKSFSVLHAAVEKCEGSFLYAYHFQSGLKARYDLEKITDNDVMEFLPEGLCSVYEGYFKRLEDELSDIKHEKFDVLKILEMLAASEGPLPLTFVARAFGLAPDCRETKDIINKINETVSCLLYVSDDMLTVFHKSVIDWLLAKGYKDHQYTVKVDDGHRSLWILCENVFAEILGRLSCALHVKFTNNVKYALEHGLVHLEECGMLEGIFWSVDIVIVYFMLTVLPEKEKYIYFWSRILQIPGVSEGLRARISWHVVELSLLYHDVHFSEISLLYLKAVVKDSPIGYFSDNEKKIAKFLMSNVLQPVELSSHEVLGLPRAAWASSRNEKITAVALSNDVKKVAVAIENFFCVISLPSLVEIVNYSTQFEKISCCAFSPDDYLILFGKLETAFDIAKGEEVPFFPGNEETFVSCAFSPNGKRLVTSDGSNAIKLWNVVRQQLLSSLCAEDPVDLCAFLPSGLFIIANSRSSKYSSFIGLDSIHTCAHSIPYGQEDSFCVWNAITLQRSDRREVFDLNLNETGVSRRVIQSCFTNIPLATSSKLIKATAIEDNLLLYADTEKLIVYSTLVPASEFSLSPPTEVFSISFSPEGSRLATCTSDGYVNIWDVRSSQVEQRFKMSEIGLQFSSWWSESYLFVFDFFKGKPRLTRIPMDVNSNILFTQSQNVSLNHLGSKFECLSTVVDFSEGFLSFKCGEIEPTKILDVTAVVMIELPGVRPTMRFTFSPCGTFVFGTCEDMYHIWKRNIEKPGLYAVFIYRNTTRNRFKHLACCFSNDAKVAVVFCPWQHVPCEIIDLESGNSKNLKFDYLGFDVKLYCINKNKVIAVLRNYIVLFEMDSGEIIDYSFERYLTDDVFMKTKLSPMENMLAFPGIKGEMVFRELSKNSSVAKN